MKKLYPITAKVLDAIDTVVDYLYESEEKHWEESGKERGHIFTYARTLAKFRNQIYQTKVKSLTKHKT